MMLYIKINTPEDDFDQIYRQVFFRTSVDMFKLFGETQGSFVMQMIIENFKKSSNMIVKYPVQEVKIQTNQKDFNFSCFRVFTH
jgi:hypothetical protein